MVRNTPEDRKGNCIETVNNLNLLIIYHKPHTLFTYMKPWGWLLTYFKNKPCTSKCLGFALCIYYLFLWNNISNFSSVQFSHSVVSDSVRPQRRQPTRLRHPWDSSSKNTGVGCHFLLESMKVKSESEVAQSCPTLCDPMDCSLPGSSVHGIF